MGLARPFAASIAALHRPRALELTDAWDRAPIHYLSNSSGNSLVECAFNETTGVTTPIRPARSCTGKYPTTKVPLVGTCPPRGWRLAA